MSDIVVEAFRPGVMARLGLDAQVLRRAKPELIYCSISGFGQSNALSELPSYAPVIHAACGYDMASFEYQSGASRPPESAIPVADFVTAVYGAFAIQSALVRRERTGQGGTIDVNLMDSMLNMLSFEVQAAQFPLSFARPTYRPLQALDGFILVAPINERNFQGVCAATGHLEWQDDPLFKLPQARYANWVEFMNRVEAWASHLPAAECEDRLLKANVPCSRYRTVAEVMADPRFAERGGFTTIRDAAGPFQTTTLPFTLDGSRPIVQGQVHDLGDDTAQVLETILGLSVDEVVRLRKAGITGVPE